MAVNKEGNEKTMPTKTSECIKPEIEEITAIFVHDKSTPGTERFKEVVPDGATPAVGSLYVKKAEVRRLGNPSSLTVTIRRTSS